MIFYRWLPSLRQTCCQCALGRVLLHSLGAISSCLSDTSLLRPGICSSLSTPRHQVVHFAAFDRSGWCLPLPYLCMEEHTLILLDVLKIHSPLLTDTVPSNHLSLRPSLDLLNSCFCLLWGCHVCHESVLGLRAKLESEHC